MLSSFGYIQHSKLENFCKLVISNNKSLISQNLKVLGPSGGKFDFFSPWGFESQSDFDYRTSKIKFYSVRALKCYLNEKNLIQGRVTATISKFSPQIFETYFTYIHACKYIICFYYRSASLSKGVRLVKVLRIFNN